MRMPLGHIASVLGAPLADELLGVAVTGISTDSRTTSPGALFLCIKGDTFDGHAYLNAAAAKGAVAAVVEQPVEAPAVPCLQVPSTVTAYARLALDYRDGFAGPVIGITGTAGKTTVKGLLAHLLEELGPVARNHRNFNNQIGLPGTILGATRDERFWVMETGINFVGDMDPLATMLRPTMAIAINAGAGHLEGLHDVPTVAAEKCKLIRAMAEGGRAVVNIDGPELRQAALATGRDVSWFSTEAHPEAAYHGEFLGLTPSGGRFRLVLDGHDIEVDTPFAAPFLTQSILAAATAAHLQGMTPGQIQSRLASASLPDQRFQPLRVGRWILIDDSYNANPVSMRAVLEAGKVLSGDGPLVLILGEMRELGEQAATAHLDLGRLAGRLAPQAVFWVGNFAQEVAEGLAEHDCSIHPQQSPEDVAAVLREVDTQEARTGVIICKGSRANALERYVAVLRPALEETCEGVQ